MTTLQEVIDAAREKAIADAFRRAGEQGEKLTPEELDKIVQKAVDNAVDEFLSELETH